MHTNINWVTGIPLILIAIIKEKNISLEAISYELNPGKEKLRASIPLHRPTHTISENEALEITIKAVLGYSVSNRSPFLISITY